MPKSLPLAYPMEKDLHLMRIFRVVAEAGGLTAAEAKLNMERSTISRHIKTIEEKLGGQLCLRGPGGFELTDFGQIVLRASIMAGDALERVRDELNSARGVFVGDLHVGLPDNCLTNPQARIVESIAAFREHAPNVRLHVSVRSPAELIEELHSRRLHLSVLGWPQSDTQLDRAFLFEEEFRLYIGRCAEPVPRLEAFVERGFGLVLRRSSRRTADLASRLKVPVKAEASGIEALATLVAAGGVLALLPTHFVDSLNSSLGIREVQGAETFAYRAKFYLAREKTRQLSAPGELFRKLMLDEHATGRSVGRRR
jgi:DNA-binding transcriptional LysR family regulator